MDARLEKQEKTDNENEPIQQIKADPGAHPIPCPGYVLERHKSGLLYRLRAEYRNYLLYHVFEATGNVFRMLGNEYYGNFNEDDINWMTHLDHEEEFCDTEGNGCCDACFLFHGFSAKGKGTLKTLVRQIIRNEERIFRATLFRSILLP